MSKFFITIVHVNSEAFRCIEFFWLTFNAKLLDGSPIMYSAFLSDEINKTMNLKVPESEQACHLYFCILPSFTF